jgi:hypothetical protein
MLGLTGKPNVGKSTFFAAATLAMVPIANYPFTTTKANIGVTYATLQCVCRELGVEDQPVGSACTDGVRFVPVKLVDCPGLVPGAWQGRGLGNQFLDEVRRADALMLVVDVSGSTDAEGRPGKPGSFDPLEDIEFLDKEFDMWFYQVLMKDWDRIARRAEMLREPLPSLLAEKLSGLQVGKPAIVKALEEADLASKKPGRWNRENLQAFAGRVRRLAKPLLIVANKIDLEPAEENLERLKASGYPIVACCAEAELALRRASEKGLINYKPGDPSFEILKPEILTREQQQALNLVREKILSRHGSTGVQKAVNTVIFNLLGLIAVFPVEDVEKLTDHEGRVLPDCYLVSEGATARQLAASIHSELAEGFIYAVEVRSKRRLGEDYRLRHRDIIKIVSSKARV